MNRFDARDNDALVKQIAAIVESLMPWATESLQKLVQAESLTGAEEPAQAIVAELIAECGLDIDWWEPDPIEMVPYAEHIGEIASFAGRPNVVGTWKGDGSGKSLILNGHIDTVDAGNEDNWNYPPFSGTLANGAVHGRGSLDMKGGVVTNLMVVRSMQALGIQSGGDIVLESVISEEDGGAGTVASILRGYRADAAIITEPTRLSIVTGQGGSLVFRITIEGKTAHGAARDEGVSSVEKFLPVFQALQDLEAERNQSIDHPMYAHLANKIPISVGTVRAGTWPSTVPETLVAEGRAGLVPGETLEGFKQEFLAAVDRAAAADPWLRRHRPRVEWFSGQFAPAELSTESPLVSALASAYFETTAFQPSIEAVTYGADMRHFINLAGIPCLMFGAGDVRIAHQNNEQMDLGSLQTAVEVLVLFALRWTSAHH